MNEERSGYCPAHNLIQEDRNARYAELKEKFDACEERFIALEHNTLGRDVFWWAVGIIAAILGWIVLNQITINDRLGDIRTQYVPRSEFQVHEQRFIAVIDKIQEDLRHKEDAHEGVPETGSHERHK